MDNSLKKLLFESIKQILKEETQGVDQFIEELNEKNPMNPKKKPMSDELKQFVRKTIVDSGCQKIEFNRMSVGLGVALHDKVVLNKIILNAFSLEQILFILFHELAHQWQYKKYGKEKMYEFYLSEDPVNDEAQAKNIAQFMLTTEKVADEWGSRKIREAQNKGLIDKDFIPQRGYSDVSADELVEQLKLFKADVEKKKIKTAEQFSDYVYNKLTNTFFDNLLSFFK